MDGLNAYPQYRASRLPWLAKIPQHWGENRAKCYYREVDERSTSGEEELLSVSHVTGVTPRSQKNVTMFKAESYVGHKICRPGDLVINTMWAWMAALGVAKHTGLVSPSYAVYRLLDEHAFVPGYADALFRAEAYRSEYICRSTGIRSSRLRLYPEKFLDIPIVCPPREEQEAIAQYLDFNAALVARFVRDKRRQIELLTQQTGITLERLVTSGTTSSDTVKGTSVGILPSHWDLLPLKRCVSTPITDGPHETPTLLDQGVDFMSAESMVDGKLDFSRRRGYISREDHERFSRKCRPQREDIFMCKSGATTGKLAVVETDLEFSVWSPLALIRADRARVLPRFLYLALQARYVQRQVQDIWSYGTQPNLGMGAMERLLIALPPTEEQVRVIEAAEDKVLLGKAAKELLGGQIKLIREFQTRLIADVVTGKLDVRQAPIQSVETELDLLIADDDIAERQEDAFDEAEGVAVGNE